MLRYLIFINVVFFCSIAFATKLEQLEIVPELANKKLIVSLRKQYVFEHHNTENMYQLNERGAYFWDRVAGNSSLELLTFDNTGKLISQQTLFEAPKGIVRDPEISHDAQRVVFSSRANKASSYHIYELNLSTKSLKQLTFMENVSDIDPNYLPNNQIVFSSTRAAKYCGCNRHIMANLYKMNSDGTNIIQIGNSIEFESTPSVLSDGRILYSRWEYVDRNFSGAQGLWTCNPDGTRHWIYWGQSTRTGVINGVQMPSGKIAAILVACHDISWGALALIDRNVDFEGKASIEKILPKSAIDLVDIPANTDIWCDSMKRCELKFEDPEPISDNAVLVSVQEKGGAQKMDLAIVDFDESALRRLLRAKDSSLGVFDAKILQTKKSANIIPQQSSFTSDTAKVYISNVYEGTHLKGVKKGDVKYLRVVENPPKLNWTNGSWKGEGDQPPAMNYHDYDHKVELGLVPVNEDGSAYFEIPANKFVYLQALDKDKNMLQSMRSGFSAMPDEIVSCTGCHESRQSPPPASTKLSLAFKRGIDKIEKTKTSDKYFSYTKMVQPILDKYCVSCHDYRDNNADRLILAGDTGIVFNHSYLQLHSKGAIKVIGAGANEVIEANTWGAKQSKIIKKINNNHSGIDMDKDDLEVLKTWIDLNAPYYPSDDAIFANNPSARSPLTAQELEELEKLSGIKIIENKNVISLKFYKLELVSFTRPELSPILAKMSEENKVKALEIIQRGSKRLNETPRPDMEGYKMSELAKHRADKFNKLVELERKSRQAIENGEKLKDPNKLD